MEFGYLGIYFILYIYNFLILGNSVVVFWKNQQAVISPSPSNHPQWYTRWVGGV